MMHRAVMYWLVMGGGAYPDITGTGAVPAGDTNDPRAAVRSLALDVPFCPAPRRSGGRRRGGTNSRCGASLPVAFDAPLCGARWRTCGRRRCGFLFARPAGEFRHGGLSGSQVRQGKKKG
jgi:hypothetical protein